MKYKMTYIWLTILMIWLAGCASLPPLPPVANQQAERALLPQPMRTEHTVGPQDVLRVEVYGEQDLSLRVVVSPDGSFSYPLIGEVKAAGLTIHQLQEHMKNSLAEFLVSPQVSVFIEEIRSQQVIVMGAVKAPGPYPISAASTLLEILGKVGGPTEEAGHEAVVVRARTGVDQTEQRHMRSVRVNIRRLLEGDMSWNIPIYAGDTIYVHPATFFYVLGEVERPGRYRLESDTTVAKALSMAGGITRFAGKKRMKVQRVVQGVRKEFRAQMNDVLLENDILIIPESAF